MAVRLMVISSLAFVVAIIENIAAAMTHETMRYINDETMTTRKDENNGPSVTWTNGYEK